MAHRFSLTFAVVFALAASRPAAAQRDTTAGQSADVATHVLRLRDGSTLVGRLLARDENAVQFSTHGVVLTIPASTVIEVRTIKGPELHEGEYWFPDANSTRLFFAPTGRMLEKGEGYYSNTYLLLQNFVGAPSNNFTFGGGFSVVPSDDFLDNNVYYLTPKLGVYASPKTNAAVGALAGFVPTDRGTSFGVLYGIVTEGTPDASMTAGVGYGYTDGALADRPLLMLGGSARTARRITLITENYAYFQHDDNEICVYSNTPPYGSNCTTNPHVQLHGVLSYGLRFMGEKISTDFAFFNVTQHFLFPGIPYISFAVKF
jgi:hypothetical protein